MTGGNGESMKNNGGGQERKQNPIRKGLRCYDKEI